MFPPSARVLCVTHAVMQSLRTARSRRRQLHLLRRAVLSPPESTCSSGARLFDKLLDGRCIMRVWVRWSSLGRIHNRTIRADILATRSGRTISTVAVYPAAPNARVGSCQQKNNRHGRAYHVCPVRTHPRHFLRNSLLSVTSIAPFAPVLATPLGRLSLAICCLSPSISISQYLSRCLYRMHLAVSPGLYSLEDLLGVRNGSLLDFLEEVRAKVRSDLRRVEHVF